MATIASICWMNDQVLATESRGWADRLSAQVGRNIAATRARLGISAQRLSNTLSAMGAPVSRAAISQIENGGRRISLAEVLAIALALQVPPVELIYDYRAAKVEAAPGHDDTTYADAWAWVSGKLRFLREPGESLAEWDGRMARPDPDGLRRRTADVEARCQAGFRERRLAACWTEVQELERSGRTMVPQPVPAEMGAESDIVSGALLRLGESFRQLSYETLAWKSFGWDADSWLESSTKDLLRKCRGVFSEDGMRFGDYALILAAGPNYSPPEPPVPPWEDAGRVAYGLAVVKNPPVAPPLRKE